MKKIHSLLEIIVANASQLDLQGGTKASLPVDSLIQVSIATLTPSENEIGDFIFRDMQRQLQDDDGLPANPTNQHDASENSDVVANVDN